MRRARAREREREREMFLSVFFLSEQVSGARASDADVRSGFGFVLLAHLYLHGMRCEQDGAKLLSFGQLDERGKERKRREEKRRVRDEMRRGADALFCWLQRVAVRIGIGGGGGGGLSSFLEGTQRASSRSRSPLFN